MPRRDNYRPKWNPDWQKTGLTPLFERPLRARYVLRIISKHSLLLVLVTPDRQRDPCWWFRKQKPVRRKYRRHTAAIVFSHAASSNASGASSIQVNVTVNAGDTVVVDATAESGAVVSTVTDSGGSTYAKRGSTGSNNAVTELWTTSAGGANASMWVKVTWTISQDSSMAVATYAGVSSLGTIATPTTGSSTAPSISITTQDNNNFVVAAMGADNGSGATWTASVGNIRTSVASSGAIFVGNAIMDNTAATPSSVTDTATLSVSSAWECCAIELRAPAGGTFPPLNPAFLGNPQMDPLLRM